MKPILVLLWKHWIIRRRRFCHTMCELISPLLFMFLVYLIKTIMMSPVVLESMNSTEVSLLFDDDEAVLRRVMYTPETDWTKDLMDEVAEKLLLDKIDHVPEETDSGIFPIESATPVIKYALENDEAIVEFHTNPNNSNTLPKTLKYKISMKTDVERIYEASVDKMYLSQNALPVQRDYVAYKPFINLQWAIDTSYLHMLTGASVNQTLDLEELPYNDEKYNAALIDTKGSMRLVILLFTLIISWASPAFAFVFLFNRITKEKNDGIQELLKMVGVSVDWICLGHFLNVLPTILLFAVVSTIILYVSEDPIILRTNPLFVFYAWILHMTSALILAFPFAYLLNIQQFVTLLAVTIYLAIMVLPAFIALKIQKKLNGKSAVYATGLFPFQPQSWFISDLAYAENFAGQAIDLNTMTDVYIDGAGTVLEAYIFWNLQIILTVILTWYLARCRPGIYGQPMRWNFLCQKSYWKGSPVVEVMEAEVDTSKDPKYFEPPPEGVHVGIRILNVTKAFPKFVALRDITLDIYKDQITVLLGHNGAGKTTLMNIIIGLMGPTSGKVLVNGMDTRSQSLEIRTLLGISPQHNLYFSDITVLEHALFFAMLKGKSRKEAYEESIRLIQTLNLEEKINFNADELSGGMKRRLQLACALSGGASVLMLDEPTSGLDVETRRELWDLLLSLRKDRTVLLTTHFMEEADALADRVAALHKGILKCDASTMFLKRAVGSGYRLSFTTVKKPDEAAITAAVHTVIQDAVVGDKSHNSISFTLPAQDSAKFPKLFAMLEDRREELGIKTIGVGQSTLDDVFLKLCSDVSVATAEEEAAALARTEPTFEKRSGAALCFSQFLMLFKRQFYYLKHIKYTFIILQVILPFVLIFATVGLSNNKRDSKQHPGAHRSSSPLSLEQYQGARQPNVLLDEGFDRELPVLRNRFEFVNFEKASDFYIDAILRARRSGHKYLVGIQMNETNAKVSYDASYRNSASVGVNLLSNMLGSRLASRDSADSAPAITALQDPPTTIEVKEAKDTDKLEGSLILFGLTTMVQLLANIQLPCKERLHCTRHIHIMCGCPIPLHWAVTLFVHLLKVLLFILLPYIIAQLCLEEDNTTDQFGFLTCVSFIIFLGTVAFSAQAYFISAVCSERTTSTALVSIIAFFGVIIPYIECYGKVYEDSIHKYIHNFVKASSYVFPSHNLAVALLDCGTIARENAYCDLNKANPQVLLVKRPSYEWLDGPKCIASGPEQYRSYYSFEKQAPGAAVMALPVQAVVYTVLLLMAEYCLFHKLLDRILNYKISIPPPRFHDPAVILEKERVDSAILQPRSEIKEAVLCHELRKRYPGLLKRFYALKGVTFGVDKGECFGLLGVNGAGKSTSFRILNGELAASRGNVYSGGYFATERIKYMRTYSYCPQFFGLDYFLTGYQNLALVLTLRGLQAKDVESETVSWIEEVGLTMYTHRVVSTYSGGCQRRLAAAVALCQRADVALLDEPTAGVDTAARRRVHAAVLRAKQTRSIIIASHSMDEMEALCDRLCIMAGGELGTLGSPGELRAQFAEGYAITFKLFPEFGVVRKPDSEGESSESTVSKGKEKVGLQKKRSKKESEAEEEEEPAVEEKTEETAEDARMAEVLAIREEFIATMYETFDCELKDEHLTTMHFHIKTLMPYSELFTTIEDLKKSYPALIQDYSVTETTLEEVFLYFAKLSQALPELQQDSI